MAVSINRGPFGACPYSESPTFWGLYWPLMFGNYHLGLVSVIMFSWKTV